MSKQQRITSLTLMPLMTIGGEGKGEGGWAGGLSLKGTGGLFLRSRLVCVCWGGGGVG